MNAAWASFAHLEDVPELLAQENWDAVIIDCLMFGALAAAENAHVPVAVLVHSAPGTLMPPRCGFEARLLESAFCTSIPDLDPLAAQVPRSFLFIGPVFGNVIIIPSGWQLPWLADDDRPLVLVSFSTSSYWDQRSRIEKTLEALASRPCRTLVIAGKAYAADLSVPENAVVVEQVPHREVLPYVAVTVTHAGHDTVSASLAHGVPLLCLPNAAADQPALAARVQEIEVPADFWTVR